MKILCVSDAKDPLVYSDNIVERYKEVDFVISCGDLPLRYYEFIVSSLNKPFYFVFGNHHLEQLYHYKKGCAFDNSYDKHHFNHGVGGDFIDGYIKKDLSTGLLIGGLGGAMRYNNQENQFTDFQMYLRIFKMIPKLLYNRIRWGRFIDILITHAPPRGINDADDICHTGFKAFLWFMRKFKPRYLLHGHIHLIDLNSERISRYCQTDIINVFSSYILEDESL